MEKLGINVSQLIWQIVAFGLLVYLLRRFLYRPVLKMLDERRRRIEQSMADAQTAAEKAAAAQVEFERRLAEARKEAQTVLAQANEMSAKMRDDILQTARQEAREMVDKARQEIEADRARSMAQLEKEVADLAISVSEKVLGESLDNNMQRRLINEFLTKTGGLK
jgi:F-type H+-transporting ATPase subunit b